MNEDKERPTVSIRTVPYEFRKPIRDRFDHQDWLRALFPSQADDYTKERMGNRATELVKRKRKTLGGRRWGRKALQGGYRDKTMLKREVLRDYFTNHPEFGSKDWFDTDEEMNLRKRVKGMRSQSHKYEVWRCTRCKKPWHSILKATYASQENDVCSKHEYLAPSNWINIPLIKQECPKCVKENKHEDE